MMLEGLMTRRGTPSDYPVFVELFRAITTEDPVPERERWEGFLAEQSLMVVHDGRVIAFANTELLADHAHIHLLAVLPEYRRRQVARFLLAAVKRELASSKFTRFSLHVRENNPIAIRLYESIGMQRAGSSVGLRVLWARIRELGPLGAGVRAELVPTTADSALESAFAITPTRLARFRERGRVVLALVSGGETLGIVVHDPTGGPSSFRLRRSDLALAALVALVPYASSEKGSVDLSIDDDPGAEAVILRLGASVWYRSYRYEGAL
jgi:GNAT superfamily N-acetyltransferase